MSTISRAEVAHLARLARLAVTESELDVFAGQLDLILTSVARVGEVAADDIPPTSHAVPLTNVVRDDVVRPSLGQQHALACAPSAEEGRFRVPRILAEDRLSGPSIATEDRLSGPSIATEDETTQERTDMGTEQS